MAGPNMTVLVMAAGTGGHVFPALAIARHLQQMGAQIEWLGTKNGMENELLSGMGMHINHITVSGLKGSSMRRKLLAPIMLVTALWQSMGVIRKVQPACVLGMGGFICGPGGIAARLLRKPLLIHEQNAVAGMTNRILARFATCVFEAFPGTFGKRAGVIYTGNPLRDDIVQLHCNPLRNFAEDRPLRILVLGGSQGAAAINKVIPAMLARWPSTPAPEVWHQTGRKAHAQTLAEYASQQQAVSELCRVDPFITDMAAAYNWADLVICRSGASTVSELAAASLPAILVPYPHHSDQQQLHNANWLVTGDAAQLLEQSRLTVETLLQMVSTMNSDRQRLRQMSANARSLAICNAGEVIASKCMELAHV